MQRLHRFSAAFSLFLLIFSGCGQSPPPGGNRVAPPPTGSTGGEVSAETGGEVSAEPFANAPKPEDLSDGIQGKLMGTDVNMEGAEFSGQLALFEGEGWGFNPSLLIFLFQDGDGLPEEQVISVRTDQEQDFSRNDPHVHCRWRNTETDSIDVEVAVDHYNLQIEFGKVDQGFLPGTLLFEIPGRDTMLSGRFRAKVEGE